MVLDVKSKNLLLVEDDKGLREVLTEELQDRGVQVQAFSNVPEIAQVRSTDWALLDLRVGSENSLEFLRQLKNQFPQIKIVMMSGFGSVASAVKAMQLGAHNFISKPVTVEMILKAFLDNEASDVEPVPEQEISLARMEREYIDYVLQTSDGNITQAAKKLGLHRQSLQRKLRKNIPNKEKRRRLGAFRSFFFFFLFEHHQYEQQANSADNRHIGDVKGRPAPAVVKMEIQEVDNVTEANTINVISDRPTKDRRQCQDLFGVVLFDRTQNAQDNNQSDRRHGQKEHLTKLGMAFGQKTEGRAKVTHIGQVEEVCDHRN